jgi:glucose/mannose transport system substrate-binding protein
MKDLAEAAKNGTLFGSLAHQHGAPVAIMEAMYDVITGHFNGEYTDEQAVQALADAVAATK